MMRLIDADEITYTSESCGYPNCKDDCDYTKDGHDMCDLMLVRKRSIDSMPTVDAVEVVRCKDCKFCHAGYCERGDDLIPHGRHDDDWENWYCADGERVTDANS